ncbi:hypothetical protein PG995_008500 [Apiospora arundinis]|uniref:Uncharacterized protein n=1 Tax=Apiospora arundinis TaxID=335852 RepID=A0ABR2JNC4_9PEZI
MQSLFSWGAASKQPLTIESDEVFPLHFLDNQMCARELVLTQTMLFDAVLDAAKVHDGLVKLLSTGDWRKLGGRLRKKRENCLELHVPKEFTEERPAVRFSAETFDISIAEHPLGSRLPRAASAAVAAEGGDPSIHPGSLDFKQFGIVTGWCTKQDDYYSRDEPVLGLRVISFLDATIVSLTVPHVIAGALALQSIFRAWSAALRDGDADGDAPTTIPPLLGARQDVLDGIGEGEEENDQTAPYVMVPREMKGWGLIKFVFRLLWSVFWRPVIGSRSVCLPHQFVSRLRDQCIKEAEAANGNGKPVFLSDGDVLTAWTTSFVVRARGGTRPALITNAVDVVGRLKNLQPQQKDREDEERGKEGVYVQNLAIGLYTDVSLDLAMNRPLGEAAHAIRRSIQEQVTDEQLRAQMRMLKERGLGQRDALFGDPDAQFLINSNWTRFNMFNACDFSPAIVSKPNKSSSAANGTTPTTPPGKPVYMHCGTVEDSRFQRDCFVITGKDLLGNYWMTAFLYPEDFASFEAYIEQTWERIR